MDRKLNTSKIVVLGEGKIYEREWDWVILI